MSKLTMHSPSQNEKGMVDITIDIQNSNVKFGDEILFTTLNSSTLSLGQVMIGEVKDGGAYVSYEDGETCTIPWKDVYLFCVLDIKDDSEMYTGN